MVIRTQDSRYALVSKPTARSNGSPQSRLLWCLDIELQQLCDYQVRVTVIVCQPVPAGK